MRCMTMSQIPFTLHRDDGMQMSWFLVEDSRPIDRSNLKELGFCFVHVWADSLTRERRIRLRGDIALDTFDASDMMTIDNDEVVKNTSDLLSLRNELASVLQNTLRP